MKVFCTTIKKPDGLYAGPNILAMDWDEAEKKAALCGATVSGVLHAIIPADGGKEWHAEDHFGEDYDAR